MDAARPMRPAGLNLPSRGARETASGPPVPFPGAAARCYDPRMADFDTWDGEMDRLLHAVGSEGRERIEGLLNRAAEAARGGRLREAAVTLEEARRVMVGNGLFRSWDEGIWCFSSLIRQIRRMSQEEPVPEEYQACLDAIPSARMDEPMTAAQKAFWYGSPSAPVGGEIRIVPPEPAGKGGCLVLVAAAAAALRGLSG